MNARTEKDDVRIAGIGNVFFGLVDEDEERVFASVVLDGKATRFIDGEGKRAVVVFRRDDSEGRGANR